MICICIRDSHYYHPHVQNEGINGLSIIRYTLPIDIFRGNIVTNMYTYLEMIMVPSHKGIKAFS